MAAPVDPRPLPGLLQGGVDGFLPQRPEALAGPFLRQHRHPLPGFGIAVPDDQVRMRVGRVLPRLVQRRQPRGALERGFLTKDPDQIPALPVAELARQGDDELVDHAGVLPVAPLLRVQPPAGRLALDRHAGADHLGLRIGPGDVADVRPRRPGGVRAPADAAHVEAENRDAVPPAAVLG